MRGDIRAWFKWVFHAMSRSPAALDSTSSGFGDVKKCRLPQAESPSSRSGARVSTARHIFRSRLHSYVLADEETTWNVDRIRNGQVWAKRWRGPAIPPWNMQIDIPEGDSRLPSLRKTSHSPVNMSPAVKISEPNLDISFQGRLPSPIEFKT